MSNALLLAARKRLVARARALLEQIPACPEALIPISVTGWNSALSDTRLQEHYELVVTGTMRLRELTNSGKSSLREAALTRPVGAHTQVQSSIPERRAPVSNPPTISRNNRGADRARKFLWPVAIIVFLLTVLYPAIDLIRPDEERLGILGFLVYVGIALVTGAGVFALVLPWPFAANQPVPSR